MNRSPSFAVLSDKPSRIERNSRPGYKSADPNRFIRRTFHVLKVAEHSFQVPMPNSPLLSNHLCFGARFFARVKVIHRSIYSRILVGVCAVAMATVLVKNEA